MRILPRPPPIPGFDSTQTRVRRRPSDEREAEIEMLRFLLDKLKKRHTWDRIKGAIATGIPVFWIVLIVSRPYIPVWTTIPVQPLLENTPTIWTIPISLAIAGFQWYNIAFYQRRVIPLVRDMYQRALTRQEARLLTMLGEALRLRTLRESFRNVWRRLNPD